MKSIAYLYRRGGAWYWRRAVPRPLRDLFEVESLRVSTRAYDTLGARQTARALNTLADAAFTEALDALEANPVDGAARVPKIEHRLRADLRRHAGATMAPIRSLSRLPAAPPPPTPTETEPSTPAGAPPTDAVDDISHHAQALLRARERRLNDLRSRQVVKTMSQLFTELNRANYEDSDEWSHNIHRQLRKASELFVALCGDLTLAEVGDAEVNDFRRKLHRLPKSYDKSPAFRGRPLAEILVASRHGLDGPDLLSRTTINKHLGAMSTLFAAAETGLPNPFADKGYSRTQLEEAQEQREMWPDHVLAHFFTTPVWQGCKHDRRRSLSGPHIIRDGLYWLPLLALFMGLLQQEAAQLLTADVKKIESIWVIDICDGAGKSLKTAGSRRRVPVPISLERLGFIDFAQAQRMRGHKVLFPDLHVRGMAQAAEAFRKKWDGYKKHFVAPEYVFHGLRHTFVTRAKHVDGISNDIVQHLDGHAPKGETAGRYFKGYELRVLKEAIDKVTFAEVERVVGRNASRLGTTGAEH